MCVEHYIVVKIVIAIDGYAHLTTYLYQELTLSDLFWSYFIITKV